MQALLRCGVIPRIVGRRSTHWLASPRTVSLIGAPQALGQPLDGVQEAPGALRGNGELSRRVAALGWRVNDRGNVCMSSDGDGVIAMAAPAPKSAELGARNAAAVFAGAARLAEAACAAASAGHFVLTLGGDHSVALGSLAGVLRARPRTGVLWVDAHADLNGPESSPSGNAHGMPLSFLLGATPAPPMLAQWLRGSGVDAGGGAAGAPPLAAADVVYIGLRDLDPAEKAAVKALRIRAFTMRDIDRLGIGRVMDDALAALLAHGPRPLHLSFDIDAVDPAIAPATGTPVPGGLSWREAHYVCEAAARSRALASLDMVEVNPALGGAPAAGEATLRLARGLVESALGKDILDE